MTEIRYEIEQILNQIEGAASLAGMVSEILELGSSEADAYSGAVRLLETALKEQAQKLDDVLDILLKEVKEVKAA